MTTLENTRMTFAELSKMLGPDGKVAPIVELLAQKNESIIDPMWQAGNLPTGHQFSQRVALPTAELRDYNEGIAPSKSAVSQAVEGMSIIEAWSEIDEAEADLNGERNAYRAKEDAAFVQALERKFAQMMIYGNASVNPKEFNGFARRVDQKTRPQFIDCAGADTGAGLAYTSIYVAEWGDDLFGIYPKGSQAGLQHRDLGRQVIQLSDNKRMTALVSQFIWNCGLVLKHPNALVRIGNVHVANLRSKSGSQALAAQTNIIEALAKAPYILPNNGGRKVAYCNRTVHAHLSIMAMRQTSSVLAIRQGLTQFGTATSWTEFLGMPLRCVDQIVNTEAEVV